jgi:hypothetical protein
MMNRGYQAADNFNNRAAVQGNYDGQNLTLGKLNGVEAQQGPSAAQAQLQQGTNQALASQIALARSGSGFGGNAAAAGMAQNNLAGIQANQANQAAMLSAQENAAWRGRQAANLGTVAGMQGQQTSANLQAALASRGQNDAMFSNQVGMGEDAYFKGQGVQMGGYGMAQHSQDQNLAAQGLSNSIRGEEMKGGSMQEDNILRQWAAKNGFTLEGQKQQDQKDAGYISAGATLLAGAAARRHHPARRDRRSRWRSRSLRRADCGSPPTPGRAAGRQPESRPLSRTADCRWRRHPRAHRS